jgi:hypothetical protein
MKWLKQKHEILYGTLIIGGFAIALGIFTFLIGPLFNNAIAFSAFLLILLFLLSYRQG